MSLWWLNFVDDAEEIQGVGIINAPDLLKAFLVAHHVGFNMDYRVHAYGPFREDAVASYWWERLLTPFEAMELNLYLATVEESVFDLYRDMPREPHACGDPDCAATASDESATEETG